MSATLLLCSLLPVLSFFLLSLSHTSRFLSLPWIFSRKGASGFSWASTVDHVTAGISASGLTAIVTGASSGIGAETARVLAARGAHVVMAVRNLAAAEDVRQAVLAESPAASLDLMELDLSSLASVRKFAGDFDATGLPLNILV